MTAPMRWLGAGRRSITFRITLVCALITTAVLLGLGLLIGQAVEQHFVEQDMDQLEGKTHLAGHLLAQAHERRRAAWVPGDAPAVLPYPDPAMTEAEL